MEVFSSKVNLLHTLILKGRQVRFPANICHATYKSRQQKDFSFRNFSVIQRFRPLKMSYLITREKYDIFTCEGTIFLHVKILVQRSNEKPRGIFYWINQIQCLITRIL